MTALPDPPRQHRGRTTSLAARTHQSVVIAVRDITHERVQIQSIVATIRVIIREYGADLARLLGVIGRVESRLRAPERSVAEHVAHRDRLLAKGKNQRRSVDVNRNGVILSARA